MMAREHPGSCVRSAVSDMGNVAHRTYRLGSVCGGGDPLFLLRELLHVLDVGSQ